MSIYDCNTWILPKGTKGIIILKKRNEVRTDEIKAIIFPNSLDEILLPYDFKIISDEGKEIQLSAERFEDLPEGSMIGFQRDGMWTIDGWRYLGGKGSLHISFLDARNCERRYMTYSFEDRKITSAFTPKFKPYRDIDASSVHLASMLMRHPPPKGDIPSFVKCLCLEYNTSKSTNTRYDLPLIEVCDSDCPVKYNTTGGTYLFTKDKTFITITVALREGEHVALVMKKYETLYN